MGVVTALCPHIGYQKAAKIAKKALASRKSVRDLILEEGIVEKDKLEYILDPLAMTEPGIK